jgi:hypothetical protein
MCYENLKIGKFKLQPKLIHNVIAKRLPVTVTASVHNRITKILCERNWKLTSRNSLYIDQKFSSTKFWYWNILGQSDANVRIHLHLHLQNYKTKQKVRPIYNLGILKTNNEEGFSNKCNINKNWAWWATNLQSVHI